MKKRIIKDFTKRVERLYIVDTMYFVFRAFYAMPAMKAPCGSPINAVHGVLSLFKNLWQTENFQRMAAVFESPGPSFRQELDPMYKANRTPPPLELKVQVAMVRVALESLGIRTLHAETFEADDVIGSLAKKAVEKDWAVTIVSNDKDLAQVLALGPRIELLRTAKGGKA